MVPLIPKINLIFFKIDQILFSYFKKFVKKRKGSNLNVWKKRKNSKTIQKPKKK